MCTVNVKGAAELMFVDRTRVEDLIRSGDLPAAKIGKSYVMLQKDVLAYIERQIVAQTAERMGVPQRKKVVIRRRPDFQPEGY